MVNKHQIFSQQEENPSSAQNSSVSFLPSLQLLRMFLLQPHTKIMVQFNMFTCIHNKVCALIILRVADKLSAACASVSLLLWAEVRLWLTTMTWITETQSCAFDYSHLICWDFTTVEKNIAFKWRLFNEKTQWRVFFVSLNFHALGFPDKACVLMTDRGERCLGGMTAVCKA